MNVSAKISSHPEPSKELFIEELFAKAAKLTRGIADLGYLVSPTGSHVGSVIFESTLEKLQKIAADFQVLESVLGRPSILKKSDVEMTKEVLARLNMRVTDSFWKNVGRDDVIELYREDGVQIFRSFNMFKTTGYSLMDLNLYSWEELWERSSFSSTQIAEAVRKILNGQEEILSFNLREDIIKEILNSKLTEPFEPRTLAVKLGQMAACHDLDSDRITGFAVTTRCRVINVGKTGDNLDFI